MGSGIGEFGWAERLLRLRIRLVARISFDLVSESTGSVATGYLGELFRVFLRTDQQNPIQCAPEISCATALPNGRATEFGRQFSPPNGESAG